MAATSKRKPGVVLTWTLGETGPDCSEELSERFGTYAQATSYFAGTLLPGLMSYLLPVEIDDHNSASIEQALAAALVEEPGAAEDIAFFQNFYHKVLLLTKEGNELQIEKQLATIVQEWNSRYHRTPGPWVRVDVYREGNL